MIAVARTGLRLWNPGANRTRWSGLLPAAGRTVLDEVADLPVSAPALGRFLGAPPFAWSTDGKRLFVNLVYFGKSTQRTVVLPYRSGASPETLWPKGLQVEKDITANPGAKVINAARTSPASDAAYVYWRSSTQSNLYRVRIPE